MISWLESIGLQKFAGNLSGNGVHGAMLVLDDAYDAEALALSMQIPIQNMEVNSIFFCRFSRTDFFIDFR